jgi:hypothetical protein
MRYFECYGRFHSSWHQPYATHPRVYSKLFKIHFRRIRSESRPTLIIFWGITASTQCECGTQGFNATTFAAEAARYLNAIVVGANAIGTRYYGRFLPSEYCGTSGYATPTGERTETKQPSEELVFFHIHKNLDTEAELMD